MVADSHNIFASWRKYFSQFLNVHGVNVIKHTEIHTIEPLMPEPRAFEFEFATEKLKIHKSPVIYQLSAELFKAGGRIIRNVIHKLIISIWNKEELPEVMKESMIVPVCKKGDETDCSNYRSI